MRIPMGDNSRRLQETSLPVQAPQSQANANTFGANVAQATIQGTAQLGKSISTMSQLGAKGLELAIKMQDDKDQADAMHASNTFQRSLQDRIYNSDTGYYSTRKMGAAYNVTKDFGAEVDKGLEEARKTLTPKAQEYFDKLIIPKVMTHMQSMAAFEYSEIQNFNKSEFESGLKNDAAALAGAKTPAEEQTYRKSIDSWIENTTYGKDLPEETKARLKREYYTIGYKNLISSLVQQGNYLGAQTVYDRVAGDLDGTVLDDLRNLIDTNSLAGRMRETYTILRKDMTPEQIVKHTESGKSPFKGAELEKFVNYTIQKGNYETSVKNKQKTETYLRDTDYIWSKDLSLDQANKYVDMIPASEGDRRKHALSELRSRFNLDSAGRPQQSNDSLYLKFIWDIDHGKGDADAINKAYESGQLTRSDKMQLLKDLQKYYIGEEDTRMKNTWGMIEAKLKEKYEGDPVKHATALAALKRGAHSAGIKDPTQLVNYFEQEMKSDGWFSNPYWAVHSKLDWADSQKHGELVQWLGQENLHLIAKGIINHRNPNYKEKWSYEDIWKFMKDTGLDQVQVIQHEDGHRGPANEPVWAAIRSLQKLGALVIAENVKNVLARYPDGNIPD